MPPKKKSTKKKAPAKKAPAKKAPAKKAPAKKASKAKGKKKRDKGGDKLIAFLEEVTEDDFLDIVRREVGMKTRRQKSTTLLEVMREQFETLAEDKCTTDTTCFLSILDSWLSDQNADNVKLAEMINKLTRAQCPVLTSQSSQYTKIRAIIGGPYRLSPVQQQRMESIVHMEKDGRNAVNEYQADVLQYTHRNKPEVDYLEWVDFITTAMVSPKWEDKFLAVLAATGRRPIELLKVTTFSRLGSDVDAKHGDDDDDDDDMDSDEEKKDPRTPPSGFA
jgi:hypothetical protein